MSRNVAKKGKTTTATKEIEEHRIIGKCEHSSDL